MGKGMVRVDRGDGRLLQFKPNDVDAFLKATPDAKVVGPHVVSDTPTPAELVASEAAAAAAGEGGAAVNFNSMTKAELTAYAAENKVDLGDAKTNAQIIERIEAAAAAAGEGGAQ